MILGERLAAAALYLLMTLFIVALALGHYAWLANA